ncbi:Na+-dependent transporters of the SNF family [Anaerobiospirillum thomasii]|uniref:Na+-dependent transporters of the SNF family n=2 Tax=Anaerobiospirillum thomasii TaxID=179995 RepID=A0A2X0X7B1_9GAMM|nr:Na+-dependent transporters of the SNF family [Anaerobiospirillum thomasii]
MGQAFFTLGLGVGSIQIFGSYMSRNYTIGYEAVTITLLDTTVAVLAGFIIFPACFSYAVEPGSGPGLIFVTLVSVFSNMEYGSVWAESSFIHALAAISTLIAVFEILLPSQWKSLR